MWMVLSKGAYPGMFHLIWFGRLQSRSRIFFFKEFKEGSDAGDVVGHCLVQIFFSSAIGSEVIICTRAPMI